MARPARKKKANKAPAKKTDPRPQPKRKKAAGQKKAGSGRKIPAKKGKPAAKGVRKKAAKKKPAAAPARSRQTSGTASSPGRKKPGPKVGQYYRTGPTGKKLGRPTKRTPDLEARVLELLSWGFAYRSAAQCIGVDPKTLRNWREESEPFSHACDVAIGAGKTMVMGKFLQKIRGGNLAAILAWMEARCPEFRRKAPEGDEPEAKPSRNVRITLDAEGRLRAQTGPQDPDDEE